MQGVPSRFHERFSEGRLIRRYDDLSSRSFAWEGRELLALVGDGPRALDRLDGIADAHARVRSPHVAAVLARGVGEKGDPYVVFDCDAVSDLAELVEAMSASGEKVPYPAAIAFNEILMDTTEAAHAHGAVLGSLCWSNVLVGHRGHPWIFGWGENFPVRRADGAIVTAPGLVQAPEVLIGGSPSQAADVYVLHATLRSLLAHVELLPLFADVANQPGEGEAVRDALVRLGVDALASEPVLRIPSVSLLRARYRTIRALAPGMPSADHEGLTTLLASLAARTSQGTPKARPVMVVDAVRRVLTVGDVALELSRRPTLWRLLARLVDSHRAAPGDPVSLDGLTEAGWPGERMLPDAARARVYVAVSTLRRLGLRDELIRRDDGYALRPDLTVELLE